MTHNTREVEEFSKKWHELGIPNGCLVQMREYHNHQLQKARQDWLREIEEVMRVDIGDASPTRLALQALLDRYQEELNKQ